MSNSNRSHWRHVGLVPILAWLVTALACGPTSAPAPPPVVTVPQPGPELAWPGDESTPVELEISNDHPTDICYLYISPPADSTWGGDWLGDSEVIPPGSERHFSVPAGSYDLMAEDCDHGLLSEQRGLSLFSPVSVSFAPTGSPAPTTDGVIVGLGTDCPQPPLTSQDEISVRVGWITGTVEQAESNAAVMDFVAWVDGDLVRDLHVPNAISGTFSTADLYGCDLDEANPIAYWDLPIGRLSDGSHLIEVEFFTDAEIYDGYDTYPAGSLGIIERTIQVGEATSDGSVAFTIANDNSTTVCYVWIGVPQSEWSDDLLGADILRANDSVSVDVVPGTWALQAEDCDNNVMAYEAALDITGPMTWRVP